MLLVMMMIKMCEYTHTNTHTHCILFLQEIDWHQALCMDDHNKSNNDCNYQTWNTLILCHNIDIQSSNLEENRKHQFSRSAIFTIHPSVSSTDQKTTGVPNFEKHIDRRPQKWQVIYSILMGNCRSVETLFRPNDRSGIWSLALDLQGSNHRHLLFRG